MSVIRVGPIMYCHCTVTNRDVRATNCSYVGLHQCAQVCDHVCVIQLCVASHKEDSWLMMIHHRQTKKDRKITNVPTRPTLLIEMVSLVQHASKRTCE